MVRVVARMGMMAENGVVVMAEVMAGVDNGGGSGGDDGRKGNNNDDDGDDDDDEETAARVVEVLLVVVVLLGSRQPLGVLGVVVMVVEVEMVMVEVIESADEWCWWYITAEGVETIERCPWKGIEYDEGTSTPPVHRDAECHQEVTIHANPKGRVGRTVH